MPAGPVEDTRGVGVLASAVANRSRNTCMAKVETSGSASANFPPVAGMAAPDR